MSNRQLKVEMEDKKVPNNSDCKICSQVFKTSGHLKNHMKSKNHKKKFYSKLGLTPKVIVERRKLVEQINKVAEKRQEVLKENDVETSKTPSANKDVGIVKIVKAAEIATGQTKEVGAQTGPNAEITSSHNPITDVDIRQLISITQPQLSYHIYLCSPCFRRSRTLRPLKLNDNLSLQFILCKKCVEVNQKIRIMYTSAV